MSEVFIINKVFTTINDKDNICGVCYDENVDMKAICKGCKKNVCSRCYASCINLNLKLDDSYDKGIRIIYKCVFCRYYNPMIDEQPCDVYRYLIRQLHASEQKYVKLLNELQRDRRDERIERDGLRLELEMNNKAKIERDELRRELEMNKDKLDILDKYCSETRRKTINKEVIINIIKGVNIQSR